MKNVEKLNTCKHIYKQNKGKMCIFSLKNVYNRKQYKQKIENSKWKIHICATHRWHVCALLIFTSVIGENNLYNFTVLLESIERLGFGCMITGKQAMILDKNKSMKTKWPLWIDGPTELLAHKFHDLLSFLGNF